MGRLTCRPILTSARPTQSNTSSSVRLLPSSREILRTLDICPWIPVDVLVALVGTRSRVTVYQALARLTAAGLIQRRQVRLGPLAGVRPTSLWAMTSLGQGIRGTPSSEFTALRRLVESLAQAELQEHSRATRLLVVTTNVDGHAARQKVWTRLIVHLCTQTGLSQLRTTIFEWPEVHRLLGVAHVAGAQSRT